MKSILNHLKSIYNVDKQLDFYYRTNLYYSRVNILNCFCNNNNNLGVTDERYCENEIIVSLTTYGKRIHDVYLTVESIMQQSRKANRIVLWLSDELKTKELPMTIQSQQKRGLEVYFCKDIRSYKKLIPSLKMYPDDVIITVDDDVIYDYDMLDKLILSYMEDKRYIYYNRGHKIRLTLNKSVEEYNKWEWNCTSMEVSPLNFPTGVGGILYPPKCFNEEVFNEEVFFDICISADDVWFKAMSLLNGVDSKKVYTRNTLGEEYLENPNVQDVALGKVNNLMRQNDVQIKAVFEKYNIYNYLFNEEAIPKL